MSPQTSIFQGLSWPGLTAIPAGDGTPPDGGAGIGPNAFIEAINSEIAVYNRTTTATIASSDLATFTGGIAPCDPYVMWDNGAQRWVVITIECATVFSHTLFLDFTKSADPTNLSTGWCKYSIDSGSEFPDFPKAGHNSSDWLVGTNDFSITSGSFDTSQLWAFKKPANGTITTCPAASVSKTSTTTQLTTVDGNPIFTPDASDQLDSGAPPSGTASDTGYFVAYELPASAGTNASEMDVIDFNRDAAGTAHFTRAGDIPVTPYTFPGGVPQPGAIAGDLIDPSDTRGLGATSHVDPTRCSGCEAVWVEHAINGPGGRSQIQWDEVNPAACTGAALCGSGALLQDGLLASPSRFFWNPRISPNGFGNEAVMNFNAGSAAQLPEIMAVSNTPADAAGVTRDPIVIQTSSHPDDDFSCPSQMGGTSPCRWGDYPAAEADPLNPGAVWNNNMYTPSAVDTNHDAQWGTQNFAISPAGPAANVTVSLAPSSVFANGTAQTVAKAKVADTGGTPVQGETVTFSSTDNGDHIGPVSDNHDGTYTATVTSSTTVGTPTITATDTSVGPAVSGQGILTQTAGPATSVGVQLSPSSIAADGASQSTATATIKDARGRSVAGDHVSFSSTDGGDHIGAVSDNHDGTYTAAITSSTTVGNPTITATDTSVAPAVSGQGTLTQIAPAVSVGVQLAPSSIVANGTSQSTATATIKDAQGRSVAGDHVSFSSTDGGDHIGAVSDNHDGTYTATITSSTTVGNPTITATDTSVAPAVSGQGTLTQTRGPAASVGVQVSPSSIVANGTSQSTATATIKDAQGHPIAGDHVSFSSTDSGNHIGAVSDNHDGTYTTTITSSTTVGTPTITATDSSVSPPVSGNTALTQLATAPPAPDVTNLTESNHTFKVGKSLATLATAGSASDGQDPLATSLIVEPVRLVGSELASLLGSELTSLLGSKPATLVGRPAQPPVATDAKANQKKIPIGTVFSFGLNTSAQVQLAFTQTLAGRKVHGKCVAQNGQNRQHARCNRTVSRGSLSLPAHAGTDRVTFAGLVSPSKKLRPGKYTMTLTARNGTGRSRPALISFTVVK